MDDEKDSVMLGARLGAMHQEGYRRVEIITGDRRRRDWLPDEKARILAECAEPGANMSSVARRFGVNRGLLNKWRKAAGLLTDRSGGKKADVPAFVPVRISHAPAETASIVVEGSDNAAGRIEIELGGGRMVLTGNVAPDLAQAVVAALRGKR